MRFTASELEGYALKLSGTMKQLENDIMADIIRRIKINGEITRSADWQIHRMHELSESKRAIKKQIKEALKLSNQEVNHLYKDIIRKGYAEDESLYKYKGKPYIPFEENIELQQLITATALQTQNEMKNITQSLGFSIKNPDGTTGFKYIADYYQQTLDKATLGIATGAFDYNTVLKKAVAELTNSGLRTVDYASAWRNRVDVATRRAVMTGFNQIVARVNDENAERLGTNYFEVSWHGGARPTHQKWQGRVYTREELETVCALGEVTGLCGANCYHSYWPFFKDIDEPTYTEEQLAKMNEEENTPVEYNGKQYTKYEALQHQRRLETTMRAQRQEIKLLKDGGANEEDITIASGKYQATSSEYTRFSKAMSLPQQRERVTIDGLGDIGQGKYTKSTKTDSKSVANSGESGIIKAGENIKVNIQLFASKEKQFGKKVGKHAIDFGLDPSKTEDREVFQKIINNIQTSPDRIAEGNWRGQEDDVLFYIKGEDVVVTKKNDEFITVLKGGVNNARVKNARNKKV